MENLKPIDQEDDYVTKADKEEKKGNKNLPKAIKARENGLLVGSTILEQYNLAKAYCSSGLLPKRFDTPEKILTAMQMAYELNLKPLNACNRIAIINGTPSLYGDLPLGLVKNSGKLEYIKEYLIDKDSKEMCLKNKNINSEPFGAICIVKRKEEPNEVEKYFTIQDAEIAGLLNRDCWKHYLKTMLKYRARSMALKDCFPDVLSGITIAEYDYNELPSNDNNIPVSDSKEVKEDKTMTDYKIELIKQAKDLFRELNFNQAKRLVYYKRYLEVENIAFATEGKLEDMIGSLNIQIEGRKANEKSKK